MQQWEYAFLTLERAVYDQDTGPKAKLTYTHSDEAEEIAGSQFRGTIRRLGDEGWELVSITTSTARIWGGAGGSQEGPSTVELVQTARDQTFCFKRPQQSSQGETKPT